LPARAWAADAADPVPSDRAADAAARLLALACAVPLALSVELRARFVCLPASGSGEISLPLLCWRGPALLLGVCWFWLSVISARTFTTQPTTVDTASALVGSGSPTSPRYLRHLWLPRCSCALSAQFCVAPADELNGRGVAVHEITSTGANDALYALTADAKLRGCHARTHCSQTRMAQAAIGAPSVSSRIPCWRWRWRSG
jgi:hypothetical protein